jgi:hypothetical protein
MRRLIFSLLLLAAPSSAQKKTIFVVTDAGGVTNFHPGSDQPELFATIGL